MTTDLPFRVEDPEFLDHRNSSPAFIKQWSLYRHRAEGLERRVTINRHAVGVGLIDEGFFVIPWYRTSWEAVADVGPFPDLDAALAHIAMEMDR